MKRQNNNVTIITRSPNKWSKKLYFTNEDTKWLPEVEYSQNIDNITDDYSFVKDADADLVLIAGMPIHYNRDILLKIKKYLPKSDSKKKDIYWNYLCIWCI